MTRAIDGQRLEGLREPGGRACDADRAAIQARNHRGKAMLAMAALLVLLLGSIPAFLSALESDGGATWLGRRVIVYGPILAVVSALALPAVARRLWRRETILSVTADGITYSRWNHRVIPWGAIRAMRHERGAARHALSLWLHDPAGWPGKSATQRFVGRINSKGGGANISIPLSGLDVKPAQVAKTADRYWREQTRPARRAR